MQWKKVRKKYYIFISIFVLESGKLLGALISKILRRIPAVLNWIRFKSQSLASLALHRFCIEITSFHSQIGPPKIVWELPWNSSRNKQMTLEFFKNSFDFIFFYVKSIYAMSRYFFENILNQKNHFCQWNYVNHEYRIFHSELFFWVIKGHSDSLFSFANI